MEDLYDESCNESEEDMSSYLQTLLHNSSSLAATPTTAAGGYFSGGGGTVAESSSGFNFNDPMYNLFTEQSDTNGLNISSTKLKNSGSNCEGSGACKIPAPSRSSKRSRAAEFHNLSEKRRRSRINEKLKALQNLIPNSNKTNKASMLDEAIEYLKQLQLQVQMLTMRNGSTLQPSYSLGSLQSMLEPSAGLELADTLPSGRDVFMETVDHSTSPHPIIMPNSTNSRFVPNFVPSIQNHYGLLNHLASSKDICRDDTLSRMQLDISCSGNNSSPGMSS